ncbi:dna repair protein-like protein rad18 [Lophiotrema nucula]|uniref:Dna repair protein-like protein rad18 n=1 Tax=Lophiotrema nucula TaxID=690887 RepID=A0A6A5ZQT8_9PLEO|nr:dna repair protein-like protein rad18 [Lophiotrema nucula]
MAPVYSSKRPRTQLEDGDDYSANGEVRPGKKPRGKRRQTPSSEASDDESLSDTASQRPQDGGVYEADSDEEARLEQATQAVVEKQFRTARQGQNIPAESGIIEEIRCMNFMCHEQLTVTLGPLINFIIGHNGSGKSAVLTALTLCLGGKATATNRGQNLKAFIKEGRDYCNLSVRIKNQGAAAYKPAMYGRSIIVERHFNMAGSSGFKLKDQNGKIVSSKKADLEDILDAFALQLDNPMNVLTQDKARQFLNDSSSKEKYKLFKKGTQLESLDTDYTVIAHELEGIHSKILVKKQDIGVLKKRADAATAKARAAANLQTMRQRENETVAQVAWAKVQEEENALSKIEEEISTADQNIHDREAAVDDTSEMFESANQAFSAANQAEQDYEAELAPAREEEEDLRSQFDDVRKRLIQIKTTEREIAGKVISKQKHIDMYERQIAEYRQRQAEADDGQHAKLLEDLEEAKQAKDVAEEVYSNHNNSLPELKKSLANAERDKAQSNQVFSEREEDVRRCQTRIREIGRDQTNWTNSYPNGAHLARLLQAIESEQRFQQPPVGPMGRYIKLLKPEWSSILEKQAGASLNAFVVTTKADQGILSNIMRRLNCNYPVYIGSTRRIDTNGHEPDPELDTWLRVLRFENDLVRNQMIINSAIDQTVLIKERKTAEIFMHDKGPRRKNVRMCFCFSDRDPSKGHFITANQTTGSVAVGPIDSWRSAARMQADKEEKRKAEEATLQRLKQVVQDLLPARDALKKLIDDSKRSIQDHEKQKRRLYISKQKAQDHVEKLEADLSAATPDAGMIEQLEENLKEVREEKNFEEEQYQDNVNEKDKADKESRASKASLERAQDRLSELNTARAKAAKKAEKLGEKRDAALRAKTDAVAAVERARSHKAEWEGPLGEQLAVVESLIQEAMQVSDRVAIPRGESYNSLEKKLQRLQEQRLQSERELGGSEDELLRKANSEKRKYKAAVDELVEHEKLEQSLKKSLTNRRYRWERFRTHISVRAQTNFNYLLYERQFRGQLQLDHKAEQLNLDVQPDSTVANGAGRQTKTLSGGEKSFSQTCLLLALWDAMGSPIRCLDEFDVFMDSVNRNISMKMMIEAARRSIGRQFIFITPQAMNNVRSEGDVKIIRMSDPERGQTALNISRNRTG